MNIVTFIYFVSITHCENLIADLIQHRTMNLFKDHRFRWVYRRVLVTCLTFFLLADLNYTRQSYGLLALNICIIF